MNPSHRNHCAAQCQKLNRHARCLQGLDVSFFLSISRWKLTVPEVSACLCAPYIPEEQQCVGILGKHLASHKTRRNLHKKKQKQVKVFLSFFGVRCALCGVETSLENIPPIHSGGRHSPLGRGPEQELVQRSGRCHQGCHQAVSQHQSEGKCPVAAACLTQHQRLYLWGTVHISNLCLHKELKKRLTNHFLLFLEMVQIQCRTNK